MAPRTILLLLGILSAGWAQNPPATPVTLAVHLLVACSAPEAGERVSFPGVEASLCLDRVPFLTEKDVRSAEVRCNSQGRPQVFLTMRESAALRELDVTRRNIGGRVGIVVNGKLAMAPTIAAASRFLYIQANYTEKQAMALVEAFNRRAGFR